MSNVFFYNDVLDSYIKASNVIKYLHSVPRDMVKFLSPVFLRKIFNENRSRWLMNAWSCFRDVAWSRRLPGTAKSWLFCIQNESFILVCWYL